MHIAEMKLTDIDSVLPFYIAYYNQREGCRWSEETARKRIHQMLTVEDSYSLIMKNDENEAIGFVAGYLKQYDDVVGYTLEEIVIACEYQHKGFGSALLREVEKRVRRKGAACVELQAVNDALHERYYGKANYHDAANFVMKVKWFE